MKNKVTAEQLVAAAWNAALQDIPKPVDIVPEGWLTSEQIAEQTNTPKSSLRKSLTQLIKIGRCEQKMFRILLNKNVRPVPHYRLK